MSDKQDQSAERALIEEANREAWRESIFWSGDHPNPNAMDRRIPERPANVEDLLAGVRESLRKAAHIFQVAERRESDAGAISGEIASKHPKEYLRPYMAKAVAGVIAADLRRAKSELVHWREYERFYVEEVKRGGGVHRIGKGEAFTPPWEGEELDVDAEANF